jgi:formylglycine-generating enzyme required for sulfatase activity
LSNNYTYSGSNNYYDVAITGITAPKGVGIGIPNELGLYDMTGNVCEWVWDYFAELPSVPQFNPTGPEAGGHGTVKGGSYLMTNEMSTLVDRFSRGVHLGSGDGGFRLVRKAQ